VGDRWRRRHLRGDLGPQHQAQNGLYVSNTKTPGHVYELSNEHHVRNEIVLDNVENWEFLAPQTEQEVGEGGDAVSLEIRNASKILVANLHAYRVTRNFARAHGGASAMRPTSASAMCM
jgi:hypothetical protein